MCVLFGKSFTFDEKCSLWRKLCWVMSFRSPELDVQNEVVISTTRSALLLLLLSHFRRVQLCVTP